MGVREIRLSREPNWGGRVEGMWRDAREGSTM